MVRPITREFRRRYIKRLQNEGVELLGSGFNAHVFQHPTLPEVAVKVVDASDKKFFQFMKWSKEHSHNPWVPRFYDCVMYDCVNDSGYGIIFMERLDKIDGSSFQLFLEELGSESKFIYKDCLEEALGKVRNDDLRTLINYLLSRVKSLDLHQANFMLRGEQVVFVDPVYGQ